MGVLSTIESELVTSSGKPKEIFKQPDNTKKTLRLEKHFKSYNLVSAFGVGLYILTPFLHNTSSKKLVLTSR